MGPLITLTYFMFLEVDQAGLFVWKKEQGLYKKEIT